MIDGVHTEVLGIVQRPGGHDERRAVGSVLLLRCDGELARDGAARLRPDEDRVAIEGKPLCCRPIARLQFEGRRGGHLAPPRTPMQNCD
jgi:hypothetical protein